VGAGIIRPISQGAVEPSGIDHVRIVNEFSGESWEAQINPTQIRESISADYSEESRLWAAPGFLVYKSTSNAEYPVELTLDQDLFPDYDIQDFYRFIKSLLYPIRLGDLWLDPPDVLFVWPHLFSVQVKVMRLDTTWAEFLRTLKPRSYTMHLMIKETGLVLVSSGDVRERVDIMQPSSASPTSLGPTR